MAKRTSPSEVQTTSAADCVIQATVREAAFAALLLCAVLKGFGARPGARLPLAAALEMAAALRIRRWEILGLRSLMQANLPSGKDRFLATLSGCLEQGRAPTASAARSPLVLAYFSAWLSQFGWSGMADLGAEVLVKPTGPLGTDELEALADYVWQQRALGTARIERACDQRSA